MDCIHGVAKIQTGLSNFHFQFHMSEGMTLYTESHGLPNYGDIFVVLFIKHQDVTSDKPFLWCRDGWLVTVPPPTPPPPPPTFIITLCWAMLSHSVMSNSLWLHGLQPGGLLCPWRFSRQEYWSGLLFLPPGDLPNPRIEPRSPAL